MEKYTEMNKAALYQLQKYVWIPKKPHILPNIYKKLKDLIRLEKGGFKMEEEEPEEEEE